MWKTCDEYLLPFGEVYLVQRWNNNWRGVITGKDKDTRIQCSATPSRGTVHYYYETVKIVQQEALKGKNPYISREAFHKFHKLRDSLRDTTHT